MALKEEMEQQGLWLFRYRGTIPLIALLAGATLILRNAQLGVTNWVLNTPREWAYDMVCLGVGLLGLLVRVYTVGHTPRNTSGRNTTRQIADEVNTSGAYSMVRHPLYVGNFLMWLGPAMLTTDLWFIVAFVLFYWVYYERIMFAEEQFVIGKHGEKYLKWAEKVPAFIPSFKNFQKSHLPFSWRKVVWSEKNGALALFVIFCAFDVAEAYVRGTQEFNRVFIYGSAFFAIFYVLLKILKKTTHVLKEPERH